MFNISKYLENVWKITNMQLINDLLSSLTELGYDLDKSKIDIVSSKEIVFNFLDDVSIVLKLCNPKFLPAQLEIMVIENCNKSNKLVKTILDISTRQPSRVEGMQFNYSGDNEVNGCSYIKDNEMKYLNYSTIQNVLQYVENVIGTDIDLETVYKLEGGFGIDVIEDIADADLNADLTMQSLKNRIINFNLFNEMGLRKDETQPKVK